jgi:hypothetical protein
LHCCFGSKVGSSFCSVRRNAIATKAVGSPRLAANSRERWRFISL